jgi:hypothetical protein
MPVHIEEVTTEITVLDGDLPLTEAQIEMLAQHVMRRIAEKQRQSRQLKEATRLRQTVAPPLLIGE